MILTEDSLVTAVPVPLVSGLDRKEVTGALVLHFLGKAQKDPEVDVSDCWCISWPWVSHIGQERLKKSGCSRKGSANLNSAQCSGKTTAGCFYLGRTLPQRSAASQRHWIAFTQSINRVVITLSVNAGYLARQFSSAAQRRAYICMRWM